MLFNVARRDDGQIDSRARVYILAVHAPTESHPIQRSTVRTNPVSPLRKVTVRTIQINLAHAIGSVTQ